MGKTLSEEIIEGKKASALDKITEPYFFLYDKSLSTLLEAVNIIAVKKGYRVVNLSEGWSGWTVCLEKK